MSLSKPRLSFMQIINMNVGFFGIQYSFGLQQTAINPIYSFLDADPGQLPLLNLAGPHVVHCHLTAPGGSSAPASSS